MNLLNKYYPKQNKYHNEKIIIDGIEFDSKLEGRRYQQLKLLERANEIKALKRQVPYILIPEYIKNGKINPIC